MEAALKAISDAGKLAASVAMMIENTGTAPTGYGHKKLRKTRTKTLTKDQAKVVKKAIVEMKKVNELIVKWKELSLIEVEKL